MISTHDIIALLLGCILGGGFALIPTLRRRRRTGLDERFSEIYKRLDAEFPQALLVPPERPRPPPPAPMPRQKTLAEVEAAENAYHMTMWGFTYYPDVGMWYRVGGDGLKVPHAAVCLYGWKKAYADAANRLM
jgi:hypothetical protein